MITRILLSLAIFSHDATSFSHLHRSFQRFQTPSVRLMPIRPNPRRESSSTSLSFKRDGENSTLMTWNDTVTSHLETLPFVIHESLDDLLEKKRNQLKKELANAAITDFQPTEPTHPLDESSPLSDFPPLTGVECYEKENLKSAEDIMKQLEQLHPLPILNPVTHPSINAHWSFVFTGVPTIGMKLITLLSRISTVLPFEILDFRDVCLSVYDRQRKAKAVVEVKVCGVWEWVLEVCTSLRRPTEEDLNGEYKDFRGERGTLLLEHFQGISLNGIDLPTPKSWHTTRTLEITYMDDDIMIARTSRGEPHLLLRSTPLCYSPDESPINYLTNGDHDTDEEMEEELCDLDSNRWTEFFSEAIEMYGERITRCLVDREFGKSQRNQQDDKGKI